MLFAFCGFAHSNYIIFIFDGDVGARIDL